MFSFVYGFAITLKISYFVMVWLILNLLILNYKKNENNDFLHWERNREK